MKVLKNNLKGDFIIRTQHNYPVDGVEFIDISPLIINKTIFSEITDLFINEIKEKHVDYVVLPEARGFLLSSVAYKLGIGIIPVRKKGKLPSDYIECTFEYEKEYGKDALELPKLVDEEYAGKKFYIIDDIYATGNTLKSIKQAINSLGGEVCGIGVIMNIKNLNKDDVFSIIDVEES